MNILMVAAICCLSLAPVTGVAQTVENDVYTIKFGRTLNTNRVFDDKFTAIDYMGEELRAGILKFGTAITGKKKENGTIEVPENASIEMKLTDAYGREVVQDVNSEALPTLLKTLKFMRNGGTSADYYTFSEIVARGGEYNLHWDYPCFDIHGDSALVIKDDPCVRIKLGEMMTVIGHDIDLTAVYNTGYPFDITQFTGTETADLKLYSVIPDEQGDATLNELISASKTLNLYRPDEPLIAAIDSLKLTYEKPEPGAYLLRMSSDCQLPNANRDFTFSVNDTLRANVTPTQTVYDAAANPALRYHLTMNYRYPYVQPSGNDKVPAVYIFTNVLKPQEDEWMKPDTLMSGVSKIEGAELAKQTLDWEGDIEVKGLSAMIVKLHR